jgi:hypothetical protein
MKKREAKRIQDEISEPKFKRRLRASFFVRFHMMIMLTGVALSGVGINKLLLLLGLRSMPARYAIAICFAYGIFFLLVRLWLWYVGIKTYRESARRSEGTGNSIDIPITDFGSSVSSGGGSGSIWSGFGGGDSGGAGVSDSWDAAPEWMSGADPLPSSGGLGLNVSASSSGIDLPDLDLGGDDGCLPIVVLLLILALLFAIFGAAGWLIYQGPSILTEVAFEAALASGLIKAARNIDRGEWTGSVLKSTWIPFTLVLVLSIALGIAAQRLCPQASRIGDVFTLCTDKFESNRKEEVK